MRRFYPVCIMLVLVSLIIVPPGLAENFEVLGSLTIKADKCFEIPDLSHTDWAGTLDVVSALGYDFDNKFSLSITSQNQHLFAGVITEMDFYPEPEEWVDVPFYGALIGCYQIRVSTGQTVLFATLNEAGDAISGYYFSTDPLKGPPFDQLEPNPNMGTFEVELVCDGETCLKPIP